VPHARLRAKSLKLKACSNQCSTEPGSKESARETTDIKVGISNESAHDACMKVATIIARVLLGLVFVVFGSNAFLHFIPMGAPPQGLAGEYFHAFAESGQVYVIGALQVIAGALLLIGRFVPLGLTILGAIIVNIWLFHVLLAPANFEPAIVVTILELFLVWRYRDAFKGILSP
jgi:putative oxidoreductase